MSELHYMVVGFAAGLGLLAIYAAALWSGHRAISRRISAGHRHCSDGAESGDHAA